MPTQAENDAAAKALKKSQMGSKASQDSTAGRVIPRLPFIPMPPKVERLSPDLVRWHKENHDAMERWREQTNVVINREPT